MNGVDPEEVSRSKASAMGYNSVVGSVSWRLQTCSALFNEAELSDGGFHVVAPFYSRGRLHLEIGISNDR